ncbi:2-oxo-4-hydroxy-4-carboxy-5-ureidoimidazoline decarboxylase [Subtercola endophyticus]|uniref:2-oxo-4-hydroxy-4-carboxy-5-ureidoimidazoline decarboxylase n=1 Tax=Subtercola endophyticus TaxID=2895559 RepID=UPI001E29C8B5|nr:2-oxo-4-hydroxy-4-carboxy-5-ureidoimidazoline decarboxylase [Subtercola endophyticus]UFS61033.1 2-oxo-4-hydroxy-4-carboxy-5-ureidoimidazoline decarboxylase [Subtercola endophyticus]
MLNLPPPELRDLLRSCLNVDRWVDEVSAKAPFGDLDALLAAARDAGPLSTSEIDQAMADHPRIGERHAADTAAAEFSRKEQASLGDDDASVNLAIAEGNVAYEERFGRVFLIRAAGRTRPEILGELRRRLSLDDQTERVIVGSELLDIAQLRLRSIYEEHSL